MAQLVLKDEAYRIVGACFEVYNTLGCGFLEAVYQEALELELSERGIPFKSQAALRIAYKGRTLSTEYKADLVCFGQILVELKAVSELVDAHRSQTLNYLHATRMPLGLLVNFGHKSDLQHERFLPRR
ncbi:GxxExxY protein [Botrimarina sp.]|uniref:GxxExxY protein n=1 Tax=Botrimarina sp. TaxID=2795802 RepID=UPI0032EE2CE2